MLFHNRPAVLWWPAETTLNAVALVQKVFNKFGTHLSAEALKFSSLFTSLVPQWKYEYEYMRIAQEKMRIHANGWRGAYKPISNTLEHKTLCLAQIVKLKSKQIKMFSSQNKEKTKDFFLCTLAPI